MTPRSGLDIGGMFRGRKLTDLLPKRDLSLLLAGLGIMPHLLHMFSIYLLNEIIPFHYEATSAEHISNVFAPILYWAWGYRNGYRGTAAEMLVPLPTSALFCNGL